MKTFVVNANRTPYDTLIDRRTRWGNPFVIGRHGNRQEVIWQYRLWLPSQRPLVASLPLLAGRTLGCPCGSPRACHGQVLALLADTWASQDRETQGHLDLCFTCGAWLDTRETENPPSGTAETEGGFNQLLLTEGTSFQSLASLSRVCKGHFHSGVESIQ